MKSSEEAVFFDSRNVLKHRRLSRAAKEIAASINEKLPPRLVSSTLSIGKQEDNYYLDRVDTFLASKHRQLDAKQTLKVYYQQYVEAIKSLFNNVNLVLAMQNYGAITNNGEVIDMHYLRKHNFEYDAKIRSLYSCSTQPRTAQREPDIEKFIVSTLKDSLKVIEQLEEDIESLKEACQSNYKLQKTEDFKEKVVNTANLLITAVNNNKINLDDFKDEICFGAKTTSFPQF